jgi:hypothetical protein
VVREHQTETAPDAKSCGSQSVTNRHTEEMTFTPQAAPLVRLTTHAPGGSTAGIHAATLNRATGSLPSGAGHSLLQLQRQYGNRHVQRVLALARQETGDGEVAPEVESAIESARRGGQALDSSVRLQMESAFGADFSSVRVHTDAKAHSLNEAVNAVAFTTGTDIFFRNGAYHPGSSSGHELLAHELTHVVQQGGSPATAGRAQRVVVRRMCPACEEEQNKIGKIQGKLVVGTTDDQYEQEADRVAKAVVTTINSGPNPASQLSPNGASVAVHRQCASGHHTSSNGECGECRRKREVASQAKVETVQRYALLASRHLVQREPFEPAGTDNSSCRDKIAEDGARCADHVNTACSVGGAGITASAALIGAGIGTLIAPGPGTLVGLAIGAVGGGIGGALAYGKCVEKMNAACRARTTKALRLCDQKFPPVVGFEQGQDQSQELAQVEQSSADVSGSPEAASNTETEENA